MKISLKEARRIERRIQEKFLRNPRTLRSSVNIFDTISIQNEFTRASKISELQVKNTLDLTFARSKIRRLIQITNESSGINALISRRERYIKILGIWEEVVVVGDEIESTQAINGALLAKRTRAESGASEYTPHAIEFVALTPEFIAIAIDNVRTTQRDLDGCDDELLTLNTITKIEIPDEIYQILVESGIM